MSILADMPDSRLLQPGAALGIQTPDWLLVLNACRSTANANSAASEQEDLTLDMLLMQLLGCQASRSCHLVREASSTTI